MFFVCNIPDTILGPVISALLGALIGGIISGYFTQKWIEKRELRDRRDNMRLNLYLKVINLILKNKKEIGQSQSTTSIPSLDIQLQRLKIKHCLKLLAPNDLYVTFEKYDNLVFQKTAQDIQFRPASYEVAKAEDDLLEKMSKGFKSTTLSEA
jgi:hypothetical protein